MTRPTRFAAEHVIITEVSPRALESYAHISIAFTVEELVEVSRRDTTESFELTPHRLDRPYEKNFDALPGEHPLVWRTRFDMSRWGILTATVDNRHVGGAIIASNTPGVHMLEGRADLAVLWDIRVSPDMRGCGVGSVLFAAAEAWARAHGCRELKVETQNNNASACRFYARQGCVLRNAVVHAYPEFPDEIQLLWYKTLAVE